MIRRSVIPGVATVALYVTALAVACPALAGHLVYTNDNNVPDNTVTAFSVATDGSLTNLGQFPTGDHGCGFSGFYASREAKISKNGDFVLAVNDCGTSVSVFSGASTGALVLVAKIPAQTSPPGTSIATDGKCLVFGFVSGDVSSFLFPKLTPVNTVNVGSTVADMKIGKPGPNRYVAAALPFGNEIAVIPLWPSTCELGTPASIPTATTSQTVPVAPTGVDFSPGSDILYVGDANALGITRVEAFSFPAGTPLPGSPFVYSSGQNSSTVLVSKNGQCLFVANQDSGGISSIPMSRGIPGPTATFFPLSPAGSPPAVPVPAGIANDITGKMFYVAGEPFFTSFTTFAGTNTVTAEIIGEGCALTESPTGPVATGVELIPLVKGGIISSLTAFP